MSKAIHTSLADGRWETLSLAQQMGNIGSEISRALRWKGKGNTERMKACVDRALELMDLSLRWAQKEQNKEVHPGVLRELTHLRDVVCDYFLCENAYNTDGEDLLRYFDQFALLPHRVG